MIRFKIMINLIRARIRVDGMKEDTVRRSVTQLDSKMGNREVDQNSQKTE